MNEQAKKTEAEVIADQIRYMDIRCCPYKNATEVAPRKELMDKLRAIGYTIGWRSYEPRPLPQINPLPPCLTVGA